ncbi:MAG: hypothetical protein IKA63_02160 [Clostridia bacterium]|nr:hypothetical protein [Clostridia bacterium]
MTEKHDLTITPRDRMMYAWEVSMGLVRAYRAYAAETAEDAAASHLFEELAERECENASRLHQLLHEEEQ